MSMLLVSFGLVVYVGTRLYHNTKDNLLANTMVLYLGILFPSFSIGYNQYACINYARSGFYYMEPFHGILYLTDSMREFYGLRDRYGLLVEPVYERIRESDCKKTATAVTMKLSTIHLPMSRTSVQTCSMR